MNYCDQLDKPIESTMYGLQKWSKSKFKKLGWMFLAIYKHNLVKNVQQYHCALLRLRDSIKAKKDITVDLYKKDDLKIKLEEINILIDFCSDNIMTNNSNLSDINPLDIDTIDPRFPLEPLDITTHCLHGWYKLCFEKLGFMVLAKYRYKLLGKIDHYYYGLIILAKSLKLKHDKLSAYGEPDKVKDFKIMLENTTMLVNFVKNTLLTSSMSGGKRRNSKKNMNILVKKTSRKTSRKSSRKTPKKPSKKMSRIMLNW
jgi:hypothetical protein